MAQIAAPTPGAAAAADLDERRYRLGVAACVVAVGAFLAARLTAWPPHEDETLALFVGQGTLGDLLDTVHGERGGAPLHFLFAWLVAHAGGGLEELRLVSAAFALGSIPLVAALASRLSDRTTALVATALASTSWILLFHGVYARMYSIFLFASALSYLALLAALRDGGRLRWILWAAPMLATVAVHPYGALVLGSQVVYVALARERVREAAVAFAGVGVLGIPFWITDLVLAGRFDVGLGGGGEKLGGPIRVVRYLGQVMADFSAGPVVMPVVLALACGGFWWLARSDRRAALLVGAVFATPTLAFLVARLGSSAAPETRHLIFALPFFATIVAAALVAIARSGRAGSIGAACLTTGLLLVGGVAWAAEKTPALFTGEAQERVDARLAASDWLAATGRADDVLLGYEPVFLGAWDRDRGFSRLVLPRADAKLAAATLRRAPKPLGRGVWILNAYDTTNVVQRSVIPVRVPRPTAAFEVRAFGPLLVIRSREPTRTADEYLEQAASAMIVGKTLAIGDADVNFATVSRAAALLGYERSASELRRSPRAQ